MVAKIFHKNLSWASGAALNMLGGYVFFFSLKLQIVVRQCEINRVKFWIYGYYVYFCYSVCIQSRLKSNFNESEQ